MGCMVLCRTFHTTPEQGQGPTPIVPHCSGSSPCSCPGTGHRRCDYTIRMEGVGLLYVYAPFDAHETFLYQGDERDEPVRVVREYKCAEERCSKTFTRFHIYFNLNSFPRTFYLLLKMQSSMQLRIYIVKFWTRVPSLGSILLIYMQFFDKFDQIIGWRPHFGGWHTPAGKSWIRLCLIYSSCIYTSVIFSCKAMLTGAINVTVFRTV